jgi:hypothetical protein
MDEQCVRSRGIVVALLVGARELGGCQGSQWAIKEEIVVHVTFGQADFGRVGERQYCY